MTDFQCATAADGARIRYRVEGRSGAPALVLSHSLGVTMGTWDAQVEALAGAFRVARYDARGHGGSDAPPGEYDIGLLARDALAVMDAAGMDAAHFVGLSMGGMVGMWIGIHQPQRLLGLVLANTTAHIPLRDMWNSRIATALSAGMESIARPTMDRWLGESFKTGAPQQYEAVVETMRGMSPVGYAGCCAALREADQRGELPRIKARTLVITGSADLATTPSVAQGLAQGLADAQVAVVENAGHLSNIEQPAAFNRLVRDFLA